MVTNTSEHSDAIETGETEVENHERDVVAEGQSHTARSVGGDSDRPTFGTESLIEEFGQALIVLDHCDEHVLIMTTGTFDRYILRGFSAGIHVVLRMASHTGGRNDQNASRSRKGERRGKFDEAHRFVGHLGGSRRGRLRSRSHGDRRRRLEEGGGS